jgi:squalene cyclase
VRADEAGVSSAQIQRAIEKARDWLEREQEADGSWECAMRTQDTRVGATALVMLALANAGMRAEEPAMRKSLDWLRRQEPEETYSVSLQTLVLAMLTPAADRAILQRNVGWLEQTQVATGPAAGSWSYGKGKGTGDNSNSQFALLALHEAARAGAKVKPDV